MTDIEVLKRKVQCVQRKAKINCTNCGSCDLLMDDDRILTAYANAVIAIQERDAAIEELRALCWACKNSRPWEKGLTPNMVTCPFMRERGVLARVGTGGMDCERWEWRGPEAAQKAKADWIKRAKRGE